MALSMLLGMRMPAAGLRRRRLASWLAGSLMLGAVCAALLERAIPDTHLALYRPLLTALTGALATEILGQRLLSHTPATTDAFTPWITVFAGSFGWLLLSQTETPASHLPLHGVLAAALCALCVQIGAASRATDRWPRSLLALCAVLLALSALLPPG